VEIRSSARKHGIVDADIRHAIHADELRLNWYDLL